MNNFIPMDVEGKFWLINLLTQETVAIAFIKKDGTERSMRCTLNMEVIPKDKHPKSKSSTDLKDSLAVYDTDKEEWRSFRWDSITSITSIFNALTKPWPWELGCTAPLL